MIHVNAFSKKTEGTKYIEKNFKIKEFACKDGSDTIFISPKLTYILQEIRNHFNAPVTINSGYRTEAYNKKIGGAENSQHKYGAAADIVVKGVTPMAVAQFAETLLPNTGGIGIYNSFTHIDIRKDKSRWVG